MVIIYSMDTGSTNAGICITKYTKKISIKYIGMLESPIRNLTEEIKYKNPTKAEREMARKKGKLVFRKEDKKSDPPFSEGFASYYSIIDSFRVDYDITEVIAERFQTRGTSMGPLIELVSTMNGAMVTMAYTNNLDYRLITASMWKNQVNKYDDLESIYKFTKKYGLTPHETDASLIGFYQASYKGLIDFEKGLSKWKKAIVRYVGG